MKTKFTIIAALALALTPAIALAHPLSNPVVRNRTTSIHDHTPQAHVRTAEAHH